MVAHPLLVLGDDVTTDHISPAGSIPARSDAGIWLTERGENPADLNVYAISRLPSVFTATAIMDCENDYYRKLT